MKTLHRFSPGTAISLFATLLCLSGGAAAAQQSPSTAIYGVLSLLPSQFTVVQAAKQVGTHRDPNQYNVHKIDEKAFDSMIGGAVLAALEKPGSHGTLVRLDPSTYSPALALASEQADVEKIAQSVAQTPLPGTGVQPQRIIVIAPFRAEPHLKLSNVTVGHGKVAGLGFYVDGMTKTRRGDNGERAKGYLGVFANLWVLVIDPVSKTVIGQQRITAGKALSAARSPDGDPWNALTAEDKVDRVQKMAAAEIERTLEELLKK